MKKIDSFAGIPICGFLSTFEILKKTISFGQSKPDNDIRKILVIKFLGIGSISLITPTISALKDGFPKAEICFLTFRSNENVLRLLDVTNKNFFIDNKNFYHFLKSTFKVLLQIRKEKIDLSFDLEFFSKFPLIVSVLGGVRKRAGFYLTSEWWRKNLLDYLGYYNHYYHVKDIFLSLAYLVKYNDPYYRMFDKYKNKYGLPVLSLKAETIVDAKKKLKVAGIKNNREIIVINPNAGPELAPHLKRWPAEYFAQLIEKINNKYTNLSIVLVGSRDERKYVQSIIERTNCDDNNIIINLAGETTLEDLLGILSLSNIFVSVDSGPMHLASLIKIPTIGLFGAETPTLYAPLSEKATVLCKPLYSVPMFTVYNGKQSILTENIPLQLITVDEVYEHVEEYINNHPTLCIASFVNQLTSKE